MSGDYTIKNLYQPGYSSFTSEAGNLPSYHIGLDKTIPVSQMGLTINPTVADQIGELSKVLNQGVIPVEVGTLDSQLFENIPLEHWEEMRRKAKLVGSKLSLHAPLVDPSGFGEKGWSESNKEISERQLKGAVERAMLLSKDEAVPVTIHASNFGGSIYKMGKEGKEAEQLLVLDKTSGQIATALSPEERMYLGRENPEKYSAEKMLDIANDSQWRKEIDNVQYQKESADRILTNIPLEMTEIYYGVLSNKIDYNSLPEPQKNLLKDLEIGQLHLQDAHSALNGVFEKAYKYGNEEQKKELLKISKSFGDALKEVGGNPVFQSRLIQDTAERLRDFNPNTLVRVEDFALEKASETLSNVALHAYETAKKEKKIAPIISVENLYQGMALSQAEDMSKLINKTREDFVKKAVGKGISEGEAKKQAEQMIGVTFDVGHLNMSKKHGWQDEDLKKEAEALSKYVKHVHLTDNFGYADVHLPIGMGNVPIKELMDALGDSGQRARKINEIGGWVNAFKTSPFPQLLQAAGSPIYSSANGPYWSQSLGFQQSYSGGYGQMLPDTHYSMFGAGFSQLPVELGGSTGKTGGRMGGGF